MAFAYLRLRACPTGSWLLVLRRPNFFIWEDKTWCYLSRIHTETVHHLNPIYHPSMNSPLDSLLFIKSCSILQNSLVLFLVQFLRDIPTRPPSSRRVISLCRDRFIDIYDHELAKQASSQCPICGGGGASTIVLLPYVYPAPHLLPPKLSEIPLPWLQIFLPGNPHIRLDLDLFALHVPFPRHFIAFFLQNAYLDFAPLVLAAFEDVEAEDVAVRETADVGSSNGAVGSRGGRDDGWVVAEADTVAAVVVQGCRFDGQERFLEGGGIGGAVDDTVEDERFHLFFFHMIDLV